MTPKQEEPQKADDLYDAIAAEITAARLEADRALKDYINQRVGYGVVGTAIVFSILFFVQFLMNPCS